MGVIIYSIWDKHNVSYAIYRLFSAHLGMTCMFVLYNIGNSCQKDIKLILTYTSDKNIINFATDTFTRGNVMFGTMPYAYKHG